MPQYENSNGVPANGILGGIPVAEQNQDYILLVKEVTSTTPEIINQTQYAIEYIIGGGILEGGEIEVRTPNQDNETNLDIVQNFPTGKNIIAQLQNATSANTQLSGELNVTGVGTIKNILYSQTGITPSSYSTSSVVFIGSDGTPVSSSDFVPNILGSMISSSTISISAGVLKHIDTYGTLLYSSTFNSGSNFNITDGNLYLSASDFDYLQYATVNVSYNITNVDSKTGQVNVKLRSNGFGGNNDVFTIVQGSGVSRNFNTNLSQADIPANTTFDVTIQSTANIEVSSIQLSITTTSPPPAADIPAGNFWSTGSGNWITGSTYLSINYGNLQDTSGFTAATKNFGLDPIQNTFEIKKGDQIRFGYNPFNTYTIYDVVTPAESNDGLVKFYLNQQLPTNLSANSSSLDNFILYRIDSNDPKYIILDVNKTPVIGDPENPLKGYIYPKYASKRSIKNRKQIQTRVSQQGLI